jgi:hypothetical protein
MSGTPLIGEPEELWSTKKRVWGIVGVVFLTVTIVAGITLAILYPLGSSEFALANSITGENIGKHLQKLQGTQVCSLLMRKKSQMLTVEVGQCSLGTTTQPSMSSRVCRTALSAR